LQQNIPYWQHNPSKVGNGSVLPYSPSDFEENFSTGENFEIIAVKAKMAHMSTVMNLAILATMAKITMILMMPS
jgi:hypothetical protein